MDHTNEIGNITVLAFLYRFGRPDPFFEQVDHPIHMTWLHGAHYDSTVQRQ